MAVSFATLPEWLNYIEGQHVRAIDLSLDRLALVRERLRASTSAVVITVGGTNGKGSTCAMLESILSAAGYRTGVYASPHLLHYNERVRIEGRLASDESLCAGFAAVEAVRENIPLTYFEYGTLAAWWLFCQCRLDVLILEVGLGGRFDAVNLFEPDCAIVTGIALDHLDFLGPDRESIGFEKAGIYRAGKPAICGDAEPPSSLLEHAKKIGAELLVRGQDYFYRPEGNNWDFIGRKTKWEGLERPSLKGNFQLDNASGVLMALECLAERLPVDRQAIDEGLSRAALAGRFQLLPGEPLTILDVAHNPQSAQALAQTLASLEKGVETWAVCGMLADKDIPGSLAFLAPLVDRWFLCDLPGPRGAQASTLAKVLGEMKVKADMACFSSPHEAFIQARSLARENGRIVAFGSFLTVADVMSAAQADR